MNKSNKFCESCQNRLRVETTDDKMIHICPSCYKPDIVRPDDTLLYEDIKKSRLTTHRKIISKIKDDPANPKEKISCPKCKWPFAKYARLGANSRIVYACIREGCGNIWIRA
jgi:DNA-directed RNA polymerase subunit M/transcription elongation factor TFIIS